MEKKEIEPTGEVIIPLMGKHKISREEAVLRLKLLFKSNILDTGHPDDPETQMQIDGFLEMDSAESSQLVAFEKCFTSCLENKEFVSGYDRLAKGNIAEIIRQLEKGKQPKNTKKEFERFSNFVRETVFSRFQNSYESKIK